MSKLSIIFKKYFSWILPITNIIFPILLVLVPLKYTYDGYEIPNWYLEEILLFIIALAYFYSSKISYDYPNEIKKLSKALNNYEQLQLDFNDALYAKDTVEIRNFELLKSILADIIRIISQEKLKLKSSERVSIFIEDSEHFNLLARFSDNPEIDKDTRYKYPKNWGFISKAFKRTNDLKSPFERKYKSINDPQLFTDLEESNVTKEEHKRLKMRSIHYLIYPLRNSENKKIGIINFESEKNDVLEIKKIFDTLKIYNNIIQMISLKIKNHPRFSEDNNEKA